MKAPASTAQAHLVPGYKLDRYELLYPHAQGGMATVWAARIQGKHGFEKLVAVKTILPAYAQEPAFRTMFLDEAKIAAGIRHPNVAEIDDLGEEDGTLYLVLEWIDGDSWQKLHTAVTARGEPFPLALSLRIAADSLAGLHAAHGLRDHSGNLLNVVHRDVSPQNILLTNTGVAKVIDFGVAKARDRLSERTKTGMLKGKLEYTAPEQARMEPSDGRVDVWAMGVILYQFLSGKLPFPGKNDLDILRRLTSGKPPEKLPSSVPGSVRDVVMRALQASPDARFATALDMQRAVESAMTQQVTTSDVASFLSAYLGDRIEARKKDMSDALAEAHKRASRRSRPDAGGAPEPPPPRRAFPSFAEAAAVPPNIPPKSAQATSTPRSLRSGPPPLPPAPPPARAQMDSPDLATIMTSSPADAADPATLYAPHPNRPAAAPAPLFQPEPAAPILGGFAPAPVAAAAVSPPAAPIPPPPGALRGSHMAAMAALTLAMLGVWGFVGSIALRARAAEPPPKAAPTAPTATPAPTPSAVVAATVAPPATSVAAAPAAPSASAAASASAVASAAAPAPSATSVSISALSDVTAKPTAAPVAVAAPVAPPPVVAAPPPVVAAPPPVAAAAPKPTAKPDKPDAKKKPKVDDGF